jgi:hypothetical protein
MVMHWTYRRDVYVNLAQALGQMRTAHDNRRVLQGRTAK